jgi:hypothetical protein
MLIQHLDALGTHGLDSSIQVSLIEIRFDLATQKKNKLEVPYDIVRRIEGTNVMFHAVDKIDPSNYVSASPKAREALRTNPSIKFFRGIPIEKNKTQTSSLAKLLAVLYRSAWYKSKVDKGLLERDDATRRISSVAEDISLKILSAEAKKNETGAQLPVIGRTAHGSVVLGLKELADQDAASFGEIDLRTSIQLTNEILAKQIATQREVKKSFDEVNFEIQTKSGRARNLYGKEYKIQQLSTSSAAETARVFGLYDSIDVETVRSQYSQIPQYPVKVGENPDKARLYFIPLQPEQTDQVKQAVAQAKQNAELARVQKKSKKAVEEDAVKYEASLLPLPRRRLKAKVILANLEGSKKSFVLLNQVFPSVPIYYWQILNEDLPRVQWKLIDFNKTYRSGPLAEASPSSYSLWTKVFTKALNREEFDPYLVWRHWGSFHKNLSNKEIVGDTGPKIWPKALNPLELTPALTYLNNLIKVVQDENNLDLDAPKIRDKANEMKVIPTPNDTEALVGPIWSELYDWQRELAQQAHTVVASGIPEKELPTYLKGVVVGVLLNSLVWQFTKEPIKRGFDLSAGMHLTNLRGKNLISRFKQGLNLYNGLNKTQQSQIYFPFSTLPHIDGMVEISKKQAFNNGLLSGIVIRSPRNKTGKEAQTGQPESATAAV